MRILLVEDNLLLRHHLGVQLQELGHLVDSASDAQEADYYCQEHELDLAIVDLGLPDEDGLSLIKRFLGGVDDCFNVVVGCHGGSSGCLLVSDARLATHAV